MECACCGRALAPGQERFVPDWVRYLAAATLAFAHAGMWAMQVLAKPACPRCRNVATVAIPAAAIMALTGVLALALLWLGRARGA